MTITNNAPSGPIGTTTAEKLDRPAGSTPQPHIVIHNAGHNPANDQSKSAGGSRLSPKTSLLDNTLLQLGIFVVFALPGYVLAILFMNKAGRKSIQVLGFGLGERVSHSAGPVFPSPCNGARWPSLQRSLVGVSVKITRASTKMTQTGSVAKIRARSASLSRGQLAHGCATPGSA